MMIMSSWRLFAIFSLIATVSSLEVTPGSDCEALCLDGHNGTTTDTATSGTTSSDIVCENDQYHSTGTGIKFKNCISCLQKSQATKGLESDAAWFMYNVRYAVDVCLFNFPEAISSINSPCIINSACLPLKNALTSGLEAPEAGAAYDYCTADNNKFSSSSWWSCVRCLQSSDDQSYLSNFLIALKAGCQRKPTDGSLIGLTGQLFSEVAVNITDTATNATMPGDGGASATAMTLGTIVGIAVGGGLVFVGAICLFIIYCRKQRKQKVQDERGLDQRPPGSNGSSITATSKSPYIPIGDHKKSSSIRSYNYELQEKQNVIHSNADYYDRLEQEVKAGREIAHYNFDPHSGHHGPGSALPTHPAYIPRALSRQSHRTNTPTPPIPRRTNTPDSYALQIYLNAVESPAVSAIRPPPQAASRTPSPARSQRSYTDNPAQPKLVNIPPPPPNRPSLVGSAKIPSLVLPSVPRIRVPKQYSPPQIIVESATPVAGRGEPGEMQISEPLTHHGERFQDRPLAGRPVISYVAPVRDIDPHDYESEVPIRSGKSTLYG
ncbi:hypothetical protein LZ32DRAFT_140952 [Colletotrichum eremochloae]|nr:hypothetical protein LZ32DRAFT_140952 [Colletotrichum eremochloae]